MKLKITWHHFLVVFLFIIIISSLIYYLSENQNQNQNIEGLKNLDISGNIDISRNLVNNEKQEDSRLVDNKESEKKSLSNNLNKEEKKDIKKLNNKRNEKNIEIQSREIKSSNNDLDTIDKKPEIPPIDNSKIKAVVSTKTGNISNKKEGFTNLNPSPISSVGPRELSLNDFFNNINFNPECCNNQIGYSYSSSTGCACLGLEHWNFINSRGGNRTFPKEF